MNTVNGDKSKS